MPRRRREVGKQKSKPRPPLVSQPVYTEHLERLVGLERVIEDAISNFSDVVFERGASPGRSVIYFRIVPVGRGLLIGVYHNIVSQDARKRTARTDG